MSQMDSDNSIDQLASKVDPLLARVSALNSEVEKLNKATKALQLSTSSCSSDKAARDDYWIKIRPELSTITGLLDAQLDKLREEQDR